MRRLALVTALTFAACHGNAASTPSGGPSTTDLDLGTLGGKHAELVTPVAGPVVPVTPAVTPATPAAPAGEPGGYDFVDDAKLLYRIAACGGDAPVPEALVKPVDRHCKAMLDRIAKFRSDYWEKHRAWFSEVVPKDIPTTVVYPFGGGDLLSALVAFPDATEITTISLELAGDPRRLRTLTPDALGGSLSALRVEIGGLLQVGSNTSLNLSAGQRNELPGQVSSFMIGLATAGFEPVAMRYFTLDGAGELHYLDKAEIDALDSSRMNGRTKALKGDWQSPNFSEAFANVEIRYRKPGETAVRIHRHLGWNLGDPYMTTHPQLIRHLAQKGKVTILTKGGSYMLQRADFSLIRGYMLDHLAWMLSDSTGIAPSYAAPAGMVQETYGSYAGAFLPGSAGNRVDASFVELWRKNPRKKLGFRFGYVDSAGSGHVVVTHPK